MRTVLSEKAKIEERLEDLERVRDSYRQDLNSTKAELNDLKISTVSEYRNTTEALEFIVLTSKRREIHLFWCWLTAMLLQ